MKPLLKRRTVYAATIVGMLIVISGFTFAASLFGGFTTTTVNGNQAAITAGVTIYGNGLSGDLFTTGVGGTAGTCTAPTSASSTSTTTVTAYVKGGSGACNGVSDYIMQLTFTTNATLTAGKTYTDSFMVSAEFGTTTTYTTDSVSVVCGVPATTGTTCQAVINIDTGVATTAPQPAVESIYVTITGN